MKHTPRTAAFLLVCALALCLFPTALASDTGHVIWQDGGTVYKQPDFNSTVLDTLAAGTPVTVTGTESHFLQVEYADPVTEARRDGWVYIAEVASAAATPPAQTPPPTPAPKPVGTGLVLCESLSMRATPDTAGDRIQFLPYETKFDILKDMGEWYHIQINGRDGYVQSLYAVMNPSYFIAVEQTPALSHPSAAAKRVALLEPGTQLPIITEIDGYYVVSLRGASAFIAK